jgi:hypothetical protein
MSDFAFSAVDRQKRIVLTQSSSSLSFSPIFGSLLLQRPRLRCGFRAVLLMGDLRGAWIILARPIQNRMPDDIVTVKGCPRSLRDSSRRS